MKKSDFDKLDLAPITKWTKDGMQNGIDEINRKSKIFKLNINNKEFMKKYEVDF